MFSFLKAALELDMKEEERNLKCSKLFFAWQQLRKQTENANAGDDLGVQQQRQQITSVRKVPGSIHSVDRRPMFQSSHLRSPMKEK